MAKFYSVRIDEQTMQIMREYKKLTGMSMAFMMKQAIKQYVKNNPPE